MTARIPRPALLIGLPVAVIGWALIALIFHATPGQDWMVFDTAAHAWMRGDTDLLLDGPRFTAVLNATHAWLTQPLVFHPWVYPPYTLLLGLPFALLPWWLDYTAFLALSFAGMIAALRLWRRDWVFLAGVVLCPATAFTLGAGQNSFMSAGLITAGLYFAPRRPVLGGMLLGLMAFKPQLGLLLPVVLVATQAWLAMAAAAVTVAGLLAISLAIPGLALWRGWLHLFLGGDPAFHHWVSAGRIYGQSVFTCLRLAGVPEALANAGQVAAIVFAGVMVWRAYRRDAGGARALAVLLCGAILAAPHVGDYDAILLGIGAMLVLMDGATGWTMALAIAVWCSTAFNPPFVFAPAVVTPLLVGGLMLRLA